MLAFVSAFCLSICQSDGALARLKGLQAIEVFMATSPKEFEGQPDVPTAADVRGVVEHRLAADRVPVVSFLAVAHDAAKLEAYQAKRKGHLIVELQLLRSGGAFAYTVTSQVVEDARLTRTGALVLAPVWSKSTIGVAAAEHLKAAVRGQIADEIDDLAEAFLKANG